MHGAPDFPILTALVLVPALGAWRWRSYPGPGRSCCGPWRWCSPSPQPPCPSAAGVHPDRHDAGYQFEANRSWVADFGISWHVGVDGISLFLVVLTGILFPIRAAGRHPHHDAKPYYAWLLLLEAGCLGVFVALDLFVFFVMFEIVLVPMYFLIGRVGLRQPGLHG